MIDYILVFIKCVAIFGEIWPKSWKFKKDNYFHHVVLFLIPTNHADFVWGWHRDASHMFCWILDIPAPNSDDNWQPPGACPTDTWRHNDAMITSSLRLNDVGDVVWT